MRESKAGHVLSRVRDHALVLFLAFAAVVNFLAFKAYFFDDSFITYRYAANLAAGKGFVFNAGERVLGTSTPLHTMLLALLGSLGFDIVTSGAAIYSLCLSACAYFGARILKEHGAPNAGALFALIVAWGAGGVFGFLGMETTLYLALIFGAFWLAPRDRPWALGLLLGLIALTRYDGVLPVGVVLLYRWTSTRKPPLREAAVPGAMLGAWLLFAQVYFGSPLPNTLGAKANDSSFMGYWQGSLGQQYWQLFSPLRRFQETTGVQPAIRVTSAVLDIPAGLVVLLLPGLVRIRRLPGGVWMLLATAALLWSGYAVIGPPVSQHWHLTPAVYCLLAFGLAGWALLPTWGRLAGLATPCALAAIVLGAALLPMGARREFRERTAGNDYTLRVEAYGQLATWIEDHDLAEDRLLTLEPGYLTYLTGQPVIDAAGLVTPGIQFHGPRSERTPVRAVAEAHQPDLMVLRSESSARDSWYLERYVPVYRAGIMQLLLARARLDRRIDRLHGTWLRNDFYHPTEPPDLRHPLAIDFQEPETPGWREVGMSTERVGRPLEDLSFLGQPVSDPYLHTLATRRERGSVLWGPAFLIDFDELALRFAGTDAERTRVRLFVNGLAVLEVGGRGPVPIEEIEEVELPVHAWRGKVGELRFLDLDGPANYLVADHVRSARYEDLIPFDDFDSGEYGPRWPQGFGAAPFPTLEIARRYGVQFTLGSHTAASLGTEGPQQLVSRPFAIERDFVSFVVYDFGGPEHRVDLLVGGEPVLGFECSSARALAALKWDLSRWRGREGTLVVTDGSAAADEWIGIDAIVFHDGAGE